VTLLIVIVAFCSYLLGSIPSGYIAGRLAGIDLRSRGSGNIGATNVLRTLGKKYAYPVFVCDVLKGFLAVRLSVFLAEHFEFAPPDADWFAILAAVACVLGHTFPVWLKFKGGKGVATSGGTMLGLAPMATLVAVLVWIVVFETTRYVSVASVIAVVALPAALGVLLKLHLAHSLPIFYSAIVLAIVVCWRHRSNFARLVRGTEQRFTRR
jgi:acyl phosphate:glycerol-3-phosphate acyltransferase